MFQAAYNCDFYITKYHAKAMAQLQSLLTNIALGLRRLETEEEAPQAGAEQPADLQQAGAEQPADLQQAGAQSAAVMQMKIFDDCFHTVLNTPVPACNVKPPAIHGTATSPPSYAQGHSHEAQPRGTATSHTSSMPLCYTKMRS
jgi:hypothetical protein